MSEWAIRSKKRAICSFAHFWWATWAIRLWLLIFGERPEQIAYAHLIFGERPEQLAHIAYFWWATWAIHSNRLLQKKKFKHTKKYNFFEEIAHLLIYHEQPERIAHGCSFVMSDLSDSLMVALLLWATWAICSQSLICLEWSEQIAYCCSFDFSDLSKWANEQMSEWANEWISSPGSAVCITPQSLTLWYHAHRGVWKKWRSKISWHTPVK